MDWSRLFNMLTRMVIRSAVDTGIDYASRRGKTASEMTPEEREQARDARQMADKARKAARIGRRFLK